MATHAKLSPSAASRYFNCIGAMAMEDGEARTTSVHADEGTAAHFIAALCLGRGEQAETYLGAIVQVGGGGECAITDNPVGQFFQIDQTAAQRIQVYLDVCRNFAQDGELVEFLVEQGLDISSLTLEDNANGTADCVIMSEDTLTVVDLKYGRGEVEAEGNYQLIIYALAAFEQFGLMADIKRVRMVIVQPKISFEPVICEMLIDDLVWEGKKVKTLATAVWSAYDSRGVWMGESVEFLTPNVDSCRFCRAKHKCPALTEQVSDIVGVKLPEVDDVSPDDIEQVKIWLNSVETRIKQQLNEGIPLKHWKLVAGRRGSRAWVDEVEAEKMLRSFRLKHDEMYKYSVITPTAAEKLLKDSSPRRWERLLDHINQPEGQPVVVPVADKRPALKIAIDEFEDLTKE